MSFGGMCSVLTPDAIFAAGFVTACILNAGLGVVIMRWCR